MRSPISPLDGRYKKYCGLLQPLKEENLLLSVAELETKWVSFLCEQGIFKVPSPSTSLLHQLADTGTYDEIREIERTTRHDVAAVVEYVRRNMPEIYKPLVHLGLTASDSLDLARTMALQDVTKSVVGKVLGVVHILQTLAKHLKSVAMLGHTHGQPASPTTVGREMGMYASRLLQLVGQLKGIVWSGKIGGATGSLNSLVFVLPRVDWKRTTDSFIRKHTDLKPTDLASQILLDSATSTSLLIMSQVAAVLLDLSRDVWQYHSLGYCYTPREDGQIGSSTMPHKRNPISFENAEGNAMLAIEMLTSLANWHSVSRMQRDLSGSTLDRNIPTAIGHLLIALGKVEEISHVRWDRDRLQKDLNNNWQVLTEAVETYIKTKTAAGELDPRYLGIVRRKYNDYPFKTEAGYTDFLYHLDLPIEHHQILYSLTPSTYLGYAACRAIAAPTDASLLKQSERKRK